MKRGRFLQTISFLPAFLLSPLVNLSQTVSDFLGRKGYLVAAGQDRFGKPLELFEGDKFYRKVSPTDSENGFFLFESVREKKGGPREHFHYEQDEWWYILEGEFIFKIGDKTFTAKAGDSVFGPRKIPHTFAKSNDGNARLIILFEPAGKMNEYFEAVAQGVTKHFTDEENAEFKRKHGFEVTGPALLYEKK
jgi:mannose-6-phosphate isomerase-like protein (cupin superfamily)